MAINRSFLLFGLLFTSAFLHAQTPDRSAYKAPYSIALSFDVKDLMGDLVSGPRADPKEQSSVDFKNWYAEANIKRWGYWGPPSKHYPAPAGLSERKAQWKRERVLAVGMSLVGRGYQHHHIPEWDPPAGWPAQADLKRPVAKGLDCPNFVSFAFNQALGFKLPSAIGNLGAMKDAPGPGEGHSTPVQRIEVPRDYAAFGTVLRSGDILFMKSGDGTITHCILWIGDIGKSPEKQPLILDSTGESGVDSNGNKIPDGIYLRAFRPTGFYFKQFSHAIRVIPDDAS